MTDICWNCRWWHCDFRLQAQTVYQGHWGGECRRHAPGNYLEVVIGRRPYRGGSQADAVFPRTTPDYWCGDFLKREEKLDATPPAAE